MSSHGVGLMFVSFKLTDMGNVNEACATASVCQDCQAPNNDRALTRQEDRPFGLPSLEALSRVQQISIHKPSRPAHLPPESGLDRASSPARLPWESRLPHGSVSKQFGAESPEAPSRPASRRHQYEDQRGWQAAGVQSSRVLRKNTRHSLRRDMSSNAWVRESDTAPAIPPYPFGDRDMLTCIRVHGLPPPRYAYESTFCATSDASVQKSLRRVLLTDQPDGQVVRLGTVGETVL